MHIVPAESSHASICANFAHRQNQGFYHVWRAVLELLKLECIYGSTWLSNLTLASNWACNCDFTAENSQWRHQQNDWLLPADTIWGMSGVAVLETNTKTEIIDRTLSQAKHKDVLISKSWQHHHDDATVLPNNQLLLLSFCSVFVVSSAILMT